MTDTLTIETRLARLEARNEIAELVTRYAMACDERDLEALAEVFTRDAVFDTPNGSMTAVGRDDIVGMFADVLAIRGPGFHWTHDHLIRFQSGTEATGILFGHAETTPNGRQSVAGLRYDDAYRLEDGAWRISRRAISFVYYVPMSEYAEAFARVERVAIGDTRVEADIPERLETYRDFNAKISGKPRNH